jgi:hypothetical protein
MLETEAPQTCAMCGMPIHHPDEAVSMVGELDRRFYFCCVWCLRVYRRQEISAAHRAIDLASMNKNQAHGM